MAGSDPRVAFVLVNWNTRDLLLCCLGRLERIRPDLHAEVVVVDNASADGSADQVERSFPGVRLERSGLNVGFARGANRGIRASRAPVVCLLNPDLLVDGEELEACLRVIEAHPGIGALGPLLLDGEGRPWEYPDRFPSAAGLALRELLPWRPKDRLSQGPLLGPDLVDVDWLAGACLFLRRDALEEIGGLDERFFLYKEDVDLCLRLRRCGRHVVRYHGARLRHLIAQSTRTNPGREADRARIEGLRSTVLYARKHMGDGPARLLATAIRLGLLLRLAKALVLGAVRGREIDRRKLRWMREALCEVARPAARPQKPVRVP